MRPETLQRVTHQILQLYTNWQLGNAQDLRRLKQSIGRGDVKHDGLIRAPSLQIFQIGRIVTALRRKRHDQRLGVINPAAQIEYADDIIRSFSLKQPRLILDDQTVQDLQLSH